MPNEILPRVIIDTNLIVSGIIAKNGLPAKLLDLWSEDKFILLVPFDQLFEIEEVLRRKKIREKYHLSEEKIIGLVTSLRLSAEIVKPVQPRDLPLHSRDSKDDFLLGASFSGNADYLVTGDQDLLVLKANPLLKNIHILSVKELLAIFSS